MRLHASILSLLCLAPCAAVAHAGAPPAAREGPPCALDAHAKELTVRCGDGKAFTVRGAGLVLPPVLRCAQDRPECCEAGFRSLRDIQVSDLLRVARGQAPLCHMLTSDVLRSRSALDFVSALPEIDDVTPPLPAAACPKGQYAARGRCHDPKALMDAIHAALVPDRNQVPVPEAAKVVEKLRGEIDASGRCPADALDIAVVMRIYAAAERRSHLLVGAAVDLAPLITRARAPQGTQHDVALPITCGYNATHRQWQQTSFHCPDDRLCFDQSHPDLMHACVGFARQSSEATFYQVFNCRGVPACHQATSGQCTGFARMVPLGQGVFLRVLVGPAAQPYYYGLVFSAPRRGAAKLREQAQEASLLLKEVLQGIGDPAERARLRQLLGPAAR